MSTFSFDTTHAIEFRISLNPPREVSAGFVSSLEIRLDDYGSNEKPDERFHVHVRARGQEKSKTTGKIDKRKRETGILFCMGFEDDIMAVEILKEIGTPDALTVSSHIAEKLAWLESRRKSELEELARG